MGEELSTGVKIGITMVVMVSILMIILIVVSLGKSFSNKYIQDVETRTNPNYEATLHEITEQTSPTPIPSIYAGIAYLDSARIVQIDIDIDGYQATYPSTAYNFYEEGMKDIARFNGKQGYLRVVEAADGLHIWVGDYAINDEGWVFIE